MARRLTGTEALDKAKQELISATTVKQFQVAQSVVMPLLLGLTLAETASVIGKSPGWVARSRLSYIKDSSEGKKPERRGGRRNSMLSLQREFDFVAYAIGRGGFHGAARVLSETLKTKLDRRVAISTAYRMIERVKKTRGIELDAEVQEKYRFWFLKATLGLFTRFPIHSATETLLKHCNQEEINGNRKSVKRSLHR